MTDYRSLSVDELLAALGQADRTPDLDLIRACLERREELAPAVLQALEDGPDPNWGDDDPRWFLEIHAGLLLCAYREPAALPVFGRVFRDPERDNVLEWFSFDLPAAYGPLAMPMLLALLNDEDAYPYARSTVMAMLVVVAQDHPEERERIVEAFRSLLPALAEDGTLPPGTQEWEQWTWIALSLADLQDEGSQPQVLALYRAGLIDESVMGNEQQYLDYFDQERDQPPRHFDVLEAYQGLHEQAAREAEWRAKVAEQTRLRAENARLAAEQAQRERLEREQAAHASHSTSDPASVRPKIGRNDPCWCGSGKKYKHCHWRQDRGR
ncbi:MAG: DUF1186 domain-containing protein [Anaerolineae bacterium]|jgi:uncharacterized protein YecA (UPF0149 family)